MNITECRDAFPSTTFKSLIFGAMMDVNSAFNSGLQALHRADAGLRRNAEAIVRQSGHIEGREDINAALVESTQHRLQAQAAVEVVQATDEIVGTLINTTA